MVRMVRMARDVLNFTRKAARGEHQKGMVQALRSIRYEVMYTWLVAQDDHPGTTARHEISALGTVLEGVRVNRIETIQDIPKILGKRGLEEQKSRK